MTDPWGTTIPNTTETGASPLILALDTSSAVGGVALCRGFEPLGEETWLAGGSQTWALSRLEADAVFVLGPLTVTLILLAVAAVLTPAAALLPHAIQRLAAIPVGIALAWLGYALWSERPQHRDLA